MWWRSKRSSREWSAADADTNPALALAGAAAAMPGQEAKFPSSCSVPAVLVDMTFKTEQ